MIDSTLPLKESSCLNCQEVVSGNFCSNCGQKFQPTKLPLKLFLEDAVETLFNIDNRIFKTLRDLFFKPGKVTREYIEGKRAQYLPPLRIYVSISIIYFILVQWSDSNQIFFINFSDEESTISDLGTIIQYAVFIMVPVFALFTSLFYRKRKAYYVEYLILSLHIHSIWFVLLIIELFTIWVDGSFEQGWVDIIAMTISTLAQMATFIYIVIYLKRTFEQ